MATAGMSQSRAGVDTFAEGMRTQFLEFLNTFHLLPGIYKQAEKESALGPDDPPLEPTDLPSYLFQLETMAAEDSYTMWVRMDDLKEWNPDFAAELQRHYFRAEPALRRAVQNFVQQHDPELAKITSDAERRDREFFVAVFDGVVRHNMRDLRVEKVGHLTCFQGTITRTSEVRPELYLGAFRCGECSTIVRGVEQQFKYSPPLICSNATCGNRKIWSLVREESVFVDWQKIKVQENNEEVPAGSLPRTLDVVLRNNMVEKAKAGDKMLLTGSLVVVPDVAVLSAPGERVSVKQGGQRNAATSAEGLTGLKSLGTRELTYKLMFIAVHTQAANRAEGMVDIRSELDETPEDVLRAYDNDLHIQEIHTMSSDPLIYQRLTRSICPSVYGHEGIKQAVLLMLLGGVHKKTPEGTNLRGDINVAIVGDPSCAKSQVLKYVAAFLPRAVYTSGKASTAAGLTASVVKEADTNEFAIEAGALMLANNGICCIDEFDKMDVKDQVAIHEAMEQQTISISKAGVQATLNARTSILAAANPVGGRYDKSKPLKYNVSLPPAILSRFDLLHIMLDETTELTDTRIAEFIIRVHRFQARAWQVPYTLEQMQRYIKYARAHRPTISPEAHDALVKAYRDLRCEDAAPGTNTAYRITVRQLEAMVRLSEALARMHCKTVITPTHVAEAKRLLKASILKIEQSDVDLDDLMPIPDLDPEDMAGAGPHRAEDQAAEEGPADDADPNADIENNAGAANGVGGPAVGNKRAASTSAAGVDERGAKRSRTAAGEGAAGTQPESAPDGSAPSAPPAAPTQRTKVTAAKFEYVKNMLVKRLLDEEAAVRSRQEQRQPLGPLSTSGGSLEDGAYGGTSEEDMMRDPEAESAGMAQAELLKWYNNIQVEKGLLTDTDAQLEEYSLACRIINHLIRKDQVLAVMSRPERQDNEEDDEYAKRVAAERVLCLHSNFAPDL